MSSFDPTPPDPTPPNKDLTNGPSGYKRETIRVTPARVGLGVAGLLALVFIIQNGDRVDFRLIVFRADQVPLWLVIVIALGLGVAIGLLIGSLRRRRKERRDREE